MTTIMIAFAWSMITALLAGLVFGWLLHVIGYDWIYGPMFTMSVTVVDAWFKARNLLSKRLGHRDKTRVITSARTIPVMFETIMPGRGRSVDIVDQVMIVAPSGEEIGEKEISYFMGHAWSRQNRGKSGLSRKHWTRDLRPVWTRERYDAMIAALEEHGFIEGRKPGRSGHLVGDYQAFIKALRGEE